jgi:solute carrier family 8 (sodium/calcium exchanger)
LSRQYADNSIGNVTGSNSVNVFLGLGLPWFIGSLYWSSGVDDATLALWKAAYNCGDTTEITEKNPDGAFVVPAGNLGTSVTVFTICAIFAIGTFVLRRKVVGAELGGNRAIALATSVVLASGGALPTVTPSWLRCPLLMRHVICT